MIAINIPHTVFLTVNILCTLITGIPRRSPFDGSFYNFSRSDCRKGPIYISEFEETCFASIQIFFWDHKSKRCRIFEYDGCSIRSNNFFPDKRTCNMIARRRSGQTIYQCNRIDYFSKEQYSPDPTDSTLAIPYTVSKSALFFFLGFCLLICAFVFLITGQCLRHKQTSTFVAGILFILTGLVMLLGLIVYISVFKSEIGSKLRPQSQIRPPLFEYEYGYSFLMYVTGLVSSQISGIGCVFLFIYRIQYQWKSKQKDICKRNSNQHVPNVYTHRPPPMHNHNQVVDRTMFYPCRRHPHAYINSNSVIHYPSPLNQKRFYFSKEQIEGSPCSVHRLRSHSNSLKDVSTSFYDFPPPPTISYQFDEHFGNRDRTLSRDVTFEEHFPNRERTLLRDCTVNTVSTTADVNCDELSGLNEPYFNDYSPSIQHDFVTFDLDEPLPIRAQSVVSISSRNGGSGLPTRKSYESDSLRRTTPV